MRISVHGQATHSHRPERAELRLAIGFEGRKRAVVLADATAVHNEVAQQAQAHTDSAAATWWGAEQVRAAPIKEYVKNSNTTITKFRATSTIRVRFADFEALGSWLGAISERDGVSVHGISWELTQQTRRDAQAKVRTAALRDAMARAGDYAAALGAGTPRLETVYEDGLRPNIASAPPAPSAYTTRAAGGPAGAGPQIALQPSDVDVTAVLTADFEVDLGADA